jgi:Flp pilus assembly secretin CpaC
MLQVKIAEVSRSLAKDIGFNLLARESGGLGSGSFSVSVAATLGPSRIRGRKPQGSVHGRADHPDYLQIQTTIGRHLDRRGRLAAGLDVLSSSTSLRMTGE